MKRFVTPFRVGMLVLMSGVLTLVALTFVRKGGLGRDESMTVYAYFRDASGLGPRSRVQIAGLAVGEVHSIQLEGTRAKATLRIQRNVQLHTDAMLTKRSESLLGDYLLDLTPGSEQAPLMPEGGEITRVVDTQGMEAVFQSLSRITGDIQEVTSSLREVLGGEQGTGSLRAIVDNMVALSGSVDATVRQTREQLDTILTNFAQVSQDVRNLSGGQSQSVAAIITNVEALTGDTRDILASIKQVIGSGQGDLSEGVSSLRQTLARLDASVRNIQEVTEKVRRGEGAVGTLLANERVGRRVGESVEDVSDLVTRVAQLQTEVQVSSDYYFDQGASRNSIGVKFIPKPDKYYLLEVVDDPRGLVETQVVQQNPPDIGDPVTQVQRITRQGIKFTAQFAKRYSFVTFRFGIMESTGGVGTDLDLFPDTLSLHVDVFNFSAEELVYPRLRTGLRLKAFDHLFASVGFDDVLNRQVREATTRRFIGGWDYFLGAGVYFTDDDLKSIIAVVPKP